MRQSVSEGAEAIRANAEARRDVAALRNSVERLSDLRVAVSELCRVVAVAPPDDSESVDATLRRLEGNIGASISATESRVESRRRVVDLQRELARLQGDAKRKEEELAGLTIRRQELDQAFRSAEQRRDQVRAISRTASATRTAIVRQVFNQSLNEIWRDLFVRLAPSEPYVPAFRIPEDGGRPAAQLVTMHRSGGQGGSPGAMLSAGNLNTAALTLFLGLHLVAGERLPLLVLDDPVQSMDEIHISQFAALLRTLSKEHGRRIVVAVHERPLFDYLALELSPAYEGDRLITVELKKTAGDSTVAESAFHYWQPDPVVEVA
jgi:exonuclease SbcC